MSLLRGRLTNAAKIHDAVRLAKPDGDLDRSLGYPSAIWVPLLFSAFARTAIHQN
jgi:hypothetical protein